MCRRAPVQRRSGWLDPMAAAVAAVCREHHLDLPRCLPREPVERTAGLRQRRLVAVLQPTRFDPDGTEVEGVARRSLGGLVRGFGARAHARVRLEPRSSMATISPRVSAGASDWQWNATKAGPTTEPRTVVGRRK